MPIQPAVLELLAALAPVLARWGRWYLFGAQAVIVHGVPRLSADVDVTVALAPDSTKRFVREMTAAGFALAVDDADFVARASVLPFVHHATAMPLDVVLAGSGLEAEFMSRASTRPIGETAVPVIDVSDLIISKILAGRPKDVDDASRLWGIHHATADVNRIRRTLAELEEALSQSDLLSSFDVIARGSGR